MNPEAKLINAGWAWKKNHDASVETWQKEDKILSFIDAYKSEFGEEPPSESEA